MNENRDIYFPKTAYDDAPLTEQELINAPVDPVAGDDRPEGQVIPTQEELEVAQEMWADYSGPETLAALPDDVSDIESGYVTVRTYLPRAITNTTVRVKSIHDIRITLTDLTELSDMPGTLTTRAVEDLLAQGFTRFGEHEATYVTDTDIRNAHDAYGRPATLHDWTNTPHTHAGTDCGGGADCPAQ